MLGDISRTNKEGSQMVWGLPRLVGHTVPTQFCRSRDEGRPLESRGHLDSITSNIRKQTSMQHSCLKLVCFDRVWNERLVLFSF